MGKFISHPYVIGPKTKAILGKDSAYYRSRILDIADERHSVFHAEEIINYTCMLQGSSLEDSRQYVKKRLGFEKKIPIPVVPSKGVYMLPTSGAKDKANIWLSFYQIAYFEQRDSRTYVQFYDGTGLYVKRSVDAFDMQYKRTSQVIAEMCRSLYASGSH